MLHKLVVLEEMSKQDRESISKSMRSALWGPAAEGESASGKKLVGRTPFLRVDVPASGTL